MAELYEDTYQNKKHFSFGENWKNFLKGLTKNKVNEAKKSLKEFLKIKDFKNKTFVDVGCGSGLFSLSASLLNFKKVVSIDIDEKSLYCVKQLRNKTPNENWIIKKGSALDKNLSKLGKFNVVYSWGVLHHTGKMYEAIKNISKLVKPKGLLYLAIYNDSKIVLEGTSLFWLKVKKRYNKSNSFVKKIMFIIYKTYLMIGITLSGTNPFSYIKTYGSRRGMNFDTDIIDWLGGYPYEYACAEKIISFMRHNNFKLINLKKVRSIGCNEFLFKRG